MIAVSALLSGIMCCDLVILDTLVLLLLFARAKSYQPGTACIHLVFDYVLGLRWASRSG